MPLSCTLDLTVYGESQDLSEIGRWFQDFDIHLQDPLESHFDVRYCNPHRLSSIDIRSCAMVRDVIASNSRLVLREISALPDLLDTLNSHTDLNEAPQPRAIRTALQRFINTVSSSYQTEVPAQFYGGIIADPMGLGKTLTMIALAAVDLEDKDTELHAGDEEAGQKSVPATLVIVPPPLIGTWEEQLSDHVVDGTLTCRRYHGKDKFSDADDLTGVDLVLTTYHTVSRELKSDNPRESFSLFSVRWRRIILDEAHFIRNSKSKMAHTICALHSQSRWAVTGTPIQNRLTDLTSLLKFIRVYPYADPKHFDADITRLWKSGDDKEAVKRLKRLSACILLRRAKGTIQLPTRRDLQCPVDFSEGEAEVYEHIRQQAIVKIDEALRDQIESLRLFCNLGLGYHSRNERRERPFLDLNDWKEIAQAAFNTQRCLKFLCCECAHRLDRHGQNMSCGHKPGCPTSRVSTSSGALEETESLDFKDAGSSSKFPSKVKALVADLLAVPADVKCIVFSTWRLTLDVVQAALDKASLRSLRFDGKVPQKDRQAVVNRFRTDPSVRIMLLTLSCGAVGLTLTAASRAYLMEPHWNPTLEEQALARIHRLGQTREVTTVRLFVRGSFEEVREVIKVQESKKQLAGVLLAPHDGGQIDNSIGALEVSRSCRP
ncbi:SNF2 family N-terminal domain-containing protein [Xylariales sp. AK1849]|nr:SNF2 family N-terminal domain-containing protein [Xylariales sp. AK1849]